MRSAWKVRFAGFPPVRRVAAGIASFTSAAAFLTRLAIALESAQNSFK